MKNLKTFIKTSIIGGLAVILPATLLILIFKWLFNWITDIIQPLTSILVAKGQLSEFIADVIAIVIIIAVCFVVGVVIRTRAGQMVQGVLEKRILQLAPGYPTIKAVVQQFLGKNKSPFSSVALIQAFGNETLMTGFITDTHDNGRYTVFVPTGPNPTSGLIFHIPREFVHPVKVSLDEAMRTVIGCGAGSTNLLDAYHKAI